MNKCYFVKDEIAGKVLIPGCWAVTHSNDITDCTCRPPETFANFEKERYNEVVQKLEARIKELELQICKYEDIEKSSD